MVGHLGSQGKQPVVTAGIDSALQKIGLCVLRGGFYSMFYLKPPAKLRGAERLVNLRTQVMDIIKTAKPDLVAIEGYSYDSISRQHSLGEIGGVLKVELMVQGIPTVIVPPTNLKKFVSGNGAASKERMIEAVGENYNIKAGNDDLADAAGLARLAYVWETGDSKRRCELETIKRLLAMNDAKPKKIYKRFWVSL